MKQQAATPGRGTSTAEVTPGRVRRDEHGKTHRANTTPNGGPHLQLERLRLKTWSNSDLSIAETWSTYLNSTMYKCVFFCTSAFFSSSGRESFLVLSSLGHAGSPPEHHAASVGPGRGPWHVLWGFKVASNHVEAFRARRAIQAHANPRTG